MNRDEEHLKLLAIFHYVVGGIAGLCALIPVIHLTIGLFLLLAPRQMWGPGQSAPPAMLGLLFIIIAGAFIVVGLTLAGCVLAAGRFLARRKHHGFCLVVACLECMFMPLGTVLGVFTIIVLMREPVKLLFAPAPPVRDN